MKTETPPKPLPIVGLPQSPKQFTAAPYRKPKGKPK